MFSVVYKTLLQMEGKDNMNSCHFLKYVSFFLWTKADFHSYDFLSCTEF